ncbi:hypothetical protein [Burkholderia oklahomensis]|uniref:hypothetical protein n=1 Tax=Burkholderia oklahomensis TaxID=342113 RepID=UPI0002F5EC65|nr:hypothetical protein [Burkholderia oklahomensis]AJX30586.1 hypothetical protein BG90_541 [Burkholderia oklahomensis C6786]AOI47795.1 ecotin precursor [Burkholderia oklahomensis C6786]KUY62984.1 ecotin precursor [Burkholderia oklahomensis C6786]MBI0360652.1 ecotin precursor [Burkholderia oklahomensis]SUW60033.1 Uncharacterised protein [Burkholderia oklahomensis]
MKKIAAVLVTAGSLALAGPASAHDRGGDIVGALIGGAVLGAIVTSALNPAPAVAYPAPVYQAPAYQAPAYQSPAYQPAQYQPAPAYGGPPAGYCYDRYRRAYVGCGAQAYDDGYGAYGYAQPQPAGW